MVDLSCTPEQVAVHIRARTKDKNGNELGVFTEDTRPTYAQVEETIAETVNLLHTVVGGVGEPCAGAARAAVALGAAADIERSYFPEQSRSDRSVYQFLRDAYNEAVAGVAECVRGNLPDADATSPEAAYGHGTMTVVSGVVYDHYTGAWGPPIPVPDPPHAEHWEEVTREPDNQ